MEVSMASDPAKVAAFNKGMARQVENHGVGGYNKVEPTNSGDHSDSQASNNSSTPDDVKKHDGDTTSGE
jgi:hypothetical protein